MTFAKESVLIVEDRAIDLRSLLLDADALGLRAVGAQAASDARAALHTRAFDVAIIDLHLGRPQGERPSGLALLAECAAAHPRMVLVAMSADPCPVLAEAALAAGAAHFFRKPLSGHAELRVAIDLARNGARLRRASRLAVPFITQDVSAALRREYPFGFVVTQGEAEKLERMAKHPTLPVLFRGPSGVGKETLARVLHSLRCGLLGRALPFEHVRCGAFSGDDLIEAIERSDEGVLFLDGVHLLDLPLQKLVYGALTRGTLKKAGNSYETPVALQLVGSTHVDLDEAVEKGAFLAELRATFHGFEEPLPPLSERPAQLRDFVRYFMLRHELPMLASDVDLLADTCARRAWPGNVRQLLRALDAGLAQVDVATTPRWSEEIAGLLLAQRPAIESGGVPSGRASSPKSEAHDTRGHDGPLSSLPKAQALLERAAKTDGALAPTLEALEKFLLARAFERHGGNMTRVCEALGLARSSLDAKRKKHGFL